MGVEPDIVDRAGHRLQPDRLNALTFESYRELASGPILEGRSWTSPTLAGTTLLVRNHEEMVAVDLAP